MASPFRCAQPCPRSVPRLTLVQRRETATQPAATNPARAIGESGDRALRQVSLCGGRLALRAQVDREGDHEVDEPHRELEPCCYRIEVEEPTEQCAEGAVFVDAAADVERDGPAAGNDAGLLQIADPIGKY